MSDEPPLAPEFDPLRILEVLAANQVDFILVGGAAATLHGSSQATYDVDLVYEPSPANLVRLARALNDLGAVGIGAAAGAGTGAASGDLRSGKRPTPDGFVQRVERFVSPVGAIDVLREARRVGGYAELLDTAEELEIRKGLRVLVADIDSIIWSKSGTGRDKDPNHIQSLERVREERRRAPPAE